jgi:hypothetical protein
MKKIELSFQKKIIALLAIAVIIAHAGNAQLKLYSIGSVSLGSVTQPPANSELQVIGNSLYSNNTGTITSSAYIRGLNTFSMDTMPDFSWWGDTKTGIFHPLLNNMAFASNGIEAMRITPNSNLVIGATADIGDRLQVTAAVNSNPLDIVSNTTIHSLYSGVNWVNDTTTLTWAVKYNNTNKFYVLGSGQVYGYGWNTISDSVMKENVQGIQNALYKVLHLNGVTYNFKAFTGISSDGKRYVASHSARQMGLIAQAVERVAPEVVSKTADGTKTVAYGNLVGLLVEAIKQEDTKVNSLKHQLDSCVLSSKEMTGRSSGPANSISNSIVCSVPEGAAQTNLMLFDMNGKLQKKITVNGKGRQEVKLNNISDGMYYYSLVADGKEIETRRIILAGNE